MHGAFRYERANVDAVPLNQVPYLVQPSLQLRPLPEDGAETEEITHWYCSWLEEEPLTRIMDACFRILSSKYNNGTQHIARRIVWLVLQFHNDFVFHHIHNYRRSITTDREWLICERQEKLRTGMVFAVFPKKRLAQFPNCSPNSDWMKYIAPDEQSVYYTPHCFMACMQSLNYFSTYIISKIAKLMTGIPLFWDLCALRPSKTSY